jgi:hypothetical protein
MSASLSLMATTWRSLSMIFSEIFMGLAPDPLGGGLRRTCRMSRRPRRNAILARHGEQAIRIGIGKELFNDAPCARIGDNGDEAAFEQLGLGVTLRAPERILGIERFFFKWPETDRNAVKMTLPDQRTDHVDVPGSARMSRPTRFFASFVALAAGFVLVKSVHTA